MVVLRSKQAIVMGPTPPGTGVIADALFEHLQNQHRQLVYFLFHHLFVTY